MRAKNKREKRVRYSTVGVKGGSCYSRKRGLEDGTRGRRETYVNLDAGHDEKLSELRRRSSGTRRNMSGIAHGEIILCRRRFLKHILVYSV